MDNYTDIDQRRYGRTSTPCITFACYNQNMCAHFFLNFITHFFITASIGQIPATLKKKQRHTQRAFGLTFR